MDSKSLSTRGRNSYTGYPSECGNPYLLCFGERYAERILPRGFTGRHSCRMRQRKAEDWSKWRGLVSEQLQSGQGVAAFCRERSLREWQFYEWKKRRAEAQGKRASIVARLELRQQQSARRCWCNCGRSFSSGRNSCCPSTPWPRRSTTHWANGWN
ncbi:MAG: IS66 family insertion sequence element accessory protein TnpA [Acidobacteriaceae bacterium]